MTKAEFAEFQKQMKENMDRFNAERTKKLTDQVRQDNQIRIKKLDSRATVPARKTPDSAGFDLSPIEGGVLQPGEVGRFSTGLVIALPKHQVGRIVPRSSRFFEGLYVDGVLDADFRGDCSLQIRNVSDHAIEIVPGQRYAQLLVFTFGRGDIVEVDALEDTERGAGGWGSTGK